MSGFNERFQLCPANGLTTHQALGRQLAGGVDGRPAHPCRFGAHPLSRALVEGTSEGGLVATQWVLHGTHTGPYFGGSPPTGRTLTLPGASFTQVEGGKIRYERVYTDRQTVTEQLGFTPKKT